MGVDLEGVIYFADENALGVAKLLLRAGRADLVHPGHRQLPQVPLGATDLEWMPVVARLDLLVLTRDRRIRSRPAELEAYRRLGIRSVWLGGKHDMNPRDLMALFKKQEVRLTQVARKNGPGPWAVSMSPSGVRPLRLPEPRT